MTPRSGHTDDWDADMQAWNLTPQQRTHHLWRLHHHHQALTERSVARYDQVTRIEGWFVLAAVIAFVVLFLITMNGGSS